MVSGQTPQFGSTVAVRPTLSNTDRFAGSIFSGEPVIATVAVRRHFSASPRTPLILKRAGEALQEFFGLLPGSDRCKSLSKRFAAPFSFATVR
jgi:hypothetical protein